MKKFGTPIGAGPGTAKLKVGFDGVGTPPLPRFWPGLLLGGVGPVPVPVPLPPGLDPVVPCELDFCCWPLPFGLGGVAVPVRVVVVELEPEDEVEVEVDDEVVVVVLEELEDADWHDSLTLVTGSLTGSEIDDNGVPGGTLTVKLSCWPPTTVTVTTHVSAEAAGIAARPSTTINVATETTSFRLLNTVA